MSIWLVFWIILSLVLLGFLGWSLYVLQQQKAVWKAFSSKHKLRFKSNALMEGAEMQGSIESYKISYFTGEHYTADARGVRKLTAVEVSLNSVMPIGLGIASGGMVALVKELGFKTEIRPEHESWSKAYIAAGDDRQVLEAYLSDERIEALAKLMKIPNIWVVLIFRSERMLLRVDTPNPLSSQEYIEKLTKLLLKAADALELKEGESRKLKAEKLSKETKDTDLALNDEDLEASSAFELEDGEGDAAEVEAPEELAVKGDEAEAESGVEPKKSSNKKTKSKKNKRL